MLGVSRVAMATALLVFSLVGAFETIEKNEVPQYKLYPCMRELQPFKYDTFLKRHLPDDQPDSCDNFNKLKWEKFLKKNQLCLRSTQSFLPSEDKQQVQDVCSKNGGKILRGNLCISTQQFFFCTIRINIENCKVKAITSEWKHIILACDKINSKCLPVHFEENPLNESPDENQPACQRPGNMH